MTGKGMGSSGQASGDSGQASGDSGQSSTSSNISDDVATKDYIKKMDEFSEEFASANISYAEKLKKAGDAKLYYEDKPEVQSQIMSLLHVHASLLTKSYDGRST
jgi:hypothetical protein